MKNLFIKERVLTALVLLMFLVFAYSSDDSKGSRKFSINIFNSK